MRPCTPLKTNAFSLSLTSGRTLAGFTYYIDYPGMPIKDTFSRTGQICPLCSFLRLKLKFGIQALIPGYSRRGSKQLRKGSHFELIEMHV